MKRRSDKANADSFTLFVNPHIPLHIAIALVFSPDDPLPWCALFKEFIKEQNKKAERWVAF